MGDPEDDCQYSDGSRVGKHINNPDVDVFRKSDKFIVVKKQVNKS